MLVTSLYIYFFLRFPPSTFFPFLRFSRRAEQHTKVSVTIYYFFHSVFLLFRLFSCLLLSFLESVIRLHKHTHPFWFVHLNPSDILRKLFLLRLSYPSMWNEKCHTNFAHEIIILSWLEDLCWMKTVTMSEKFNVSGTISTFEYYIVKFSYANN